MRHRGVEFRSVGLEQDASSGRVEEDDLTVIKLLSMCMNSGPSESYRTHPSFEGPLIRGTWFCCQSSSTCLLWLISDKIHELIGVKLWITISMTVTTWKERAAHQNSLSLSLDSPCWTNIKRMAMTRQRDSGWRWQAQAGDQITMIGALVMPLLEALRLWWESIVSLLSLCNS